MEKNGHRTTRKKGSFYEHRCIQKKRKQKRDNPGVSLLAQPMWHAGREAASIEVAAAYNSVHIQTDRQTINHKLKQVSKNI